MAMARPTSGPGLGSGPLGVQPWGGGTITTPAPATSWYRVEMTVGSHFWSVEYGDPPDYGVRLPLTLGWQIPETAGYPAMADPTRMTFSLLAPAADELADITKGVTVEFTMWVDPAPGADPWQFFSGVVTQVDGTITDAGNFRATIYAGDNFLRLADMVIGFTTPWPQEGIADRLFRIGDEAGIDIDFLLLSDDAPNAEMPARSGSITALTAVRDCLADLASEEEISPGVFVYGKWVPQTDTAGNVTLFNFQRRYYSGSTLTLDGDNVSAVGEWSKIPAHPTSEWVIVDESTFGTPTGTPLVRRTNLVNTIGSYASAIHNLGNSLLPDLSTQLEGWFTNRITYQSWLDPAPMGPYFLGGEGLPSYAPPRFVTSILVQPLAADYDVNGQGYLGGTLIGAQLVIPPGGRHYVNLALRPEQLFGFNH